MLTTCSKQWLSSNTGLTSSKCFCNYWGSNHHFQQTQTQFRLGNNKPCNGSVICLHVENSLNTSVVNREVIKCLSKIPRDNGACVLSPSVLSDSLDSLLDSSVHGVFQVRILEWVAISSSRGIFQTQGSNSRLLHFLPWQAYSLSLSHLGCPGWPNLYFLNITAGSQLQKTAAYRVVYQLSLVVTN